MPIIKDEIRTTRGEQAVEPTANDAIIERTVVRTLRHLTDRPLPVRARSLRTLAAARYLGLDAATLQDWRTQKPPKGPAVRRIGARCIYLVEELDRYLDALPMDGASEDDNPPGLAEDGVHR
jgi:hypothetical protein